MAGQAGRGKAGLCSAVAGALCECWYGEAGGDAAGSDQCQSGIKRGGQAGRWAAICLLLPGAERRCKPLKEQSGLQQTLVAGRIDSDERLKGSGQQKNTK